MPINCKIQTPQMSVKHMLRLLSSEGELFGKRVMENSFGRGNVLVEIVKEYIESGIRLKKTGNEISFEMSNKIFGCEIEEELVNITKKRLNKLLCEYGIPNVSWRLYNENYLNFNMNKVDYIIGNPPYITYHDLDTSTRNELRSKFSSCQSGRFDYYYPFIEKSISELVPGGYLVYVIPFNIFRNNSARELRGIIKDDLVEVYDYAEVDFFPGVIISPTIIVYKKGARKNEVEYYNVKKNNHICIKKDDLGDKWYFNNRIKRTHRFGDFFSVSNGVATLLNEAFLLKNVEDIDEYYCYVNDEKIEKNVIKKAVSPKSIKNKKDYWMIFPYYCDNKRIYHYEEIEFKTKYPNAYNYLKKYYGQLINRKCSKKTQWFEYGRTQALSDICKDKIIIPMIITGEASVNIVQGDTIPYAGYYIIEKASLSLKDAKEILESKDFSEYVRDCGTPTTGNSYRISVKDIENYTF